MFPREKIPHFSFLLWFLYSKKSRARGPGSVMSGSLKQLVINQDGVGGRGMCATEGRLWERCWPKHDRNAAPAGGGQEKVPGNQDGWRVNKRSRCWLSGLWPVPRPGRHAPTRQHVRPLPASLKQSPHLWFPKPLKWRRTKWCSSLIGHWALVAEVSNFSKL